MMIIRVEEDYRYSDVEFALYRRVVEYITGALKDGFANYVNVAFEVQRVEENPTMAQEIGLDETVAIILMNVDVAGRATEKIRICMPGTLLEAIFQVIDTRKHLARGFFYEDNRETILANIRCTKLPVTHSLEPCIWIWKTFTGSSQGMSLTWENRKIVLLRCLSDASPRLQGRWGGIKRMLPFVSSPDIRKKRMKEKRLENS